jgi:hypothetical protein
MYGRSRCSQAPGEVSRGLLIRTVGVSLLLIWTCSPYLKVKHKEIHETFTGFLEAFCHYNNTPTILPDPQIQFSHQNQKDYGLNKQINHVIPVSYRHMNPAVARP